MKNPQKDANPTEGRTENSESPNPALANTILSDSPNEGESKMKCEHCGQESAVKCGKDKNGFQRFVCNNCGKKFTESHALAGRRTSMDDAVKVLEMLLEGMSVRSCERLTGMNTDTILSIMVEAGENCRRFMERAIKNVSAAHVECDEQWAFVFCKRRTANLKGWNDDSVGDRYVFTAIDRDSKLLLCWHAGARSQADTWLFADKLRKAVGGRPTVNTDGFSAYASAIPTTFNENVDFAQIVKNFQNLNAKEAAVRYSPGTIASVSKTVVCGSVPEHEIGTSRMERFNLTTRMQVRRFTRLTNAHSKKQRNHDAMLGLYFAWYNFCRKHSTIKTTPAVKAGLVPTEWSLDKLLTVAAAA